LPAEEVSKASSENEMERATQKARKNKRKLLNADNCHKKAKYDYLDIPGIVEPRGTRNDGYLKNKKDMAIPGIEPGTLALLARCSNQLS
jgi:hypothetical protein